MASSLMSTPVKTSGDTAKKQRQRSLRSRSYAIRNLQIGSFIVDLSHPQSSCTNKIRFYFVQGKLVYDFEFEYWVDQSPRKFLAAICIPFDTITGICCKSKDIYIDVCLPPRLVVGSNGLHSVPPPIGVDITGGQLRLVGRHKLSLARAQGSLIQQQLKVHHGFADLFMDVDTPHGLNIGVSSTDTMTASDQQSEDKFDEADQAVINEQTSSV